ncbi:hypothetical protein [Methylocapsa sp. S129]|uniref:hypothetical protein n=1 Tax=Methylocapsa sp. S129 TaxID=1641869 RepID=UPI001FEE5BC5|nr:hypothetical protein [Methylocapsa sp. S129]
MEPSESPWRWASQDRIIHFVEPIVGALGLQDWTFAAPLFIGETVHVEVEIVGKRITSRGDRGIVQRKLSLLNQIDALLQHGRADVMLQLFHPTISER